MRIIRGINEIINTAIAYWWIGLPLLLGGIAVYLLLPRPRGNRVLTGAALGLLALFLSGFMLVRAGAATVEAFLFYVFAFLAIGSGVLLVTQRNPARAAISFALVVLSTTGLFLLQAAPFLMAATIIIYAGAIVVTFLFVIMLAQQEGLSDADARSREPFLSTVTGFLLLAALLFVLHRSYGVGGHGSATDELDNLLTTTRQALELNDTGRIAELLQGTQGQDFFARYESVVSRYGLFDLASRVRDVGYNVPREDLREAKLDDLKEALTQLEAVGTQARGEIVKRLAVLTPGPHSDRPGQATLSNMSGPPSSTPPDQLRRDAEGRPLLPADNSTYLGRSLFTDFLLPVELGGILLLVATVGAIAIAQRRASSERQS